MEKTKKMLIECELRHGNMVLTTISGRYNLQIYSPALKVRNYHREEVECVFRRYDTVLCYEELDIILDAIMKAVNTLWTSKQH